MKPCLEARFWLVASESAFQRIAGSCDRDLACRKFVLLNKQTSRSVNGRSQDHDSAPACLEARFSLADATTPVQRASRRVRSKSTLEELHLPRQADTEGERMAGVSRRG